MSSANKNAIRRRLFLSNTDKDNIERVRNREDYELNEASQYANFPTYDPDVVLKSFTDRDENANRRFFGKTWEKIRQNIVGQTMWVVLIYLFFYYLVQILFVQGTINVCEWFGNSTNLNGPKFQSCYKHPNVTSNDTTENNDLLSHCVCAKTFAHFVESWEAKQSGYVIWI